MLDEDNSPTSIGGWAWPGLHRELHNFTFYDLTLKSAAIYSLNSYSGILSRLLSHFILRISEIFYSLGISLHLATFFDGQAEARLYMPSNFFQPVANLYQNLSVNYTYKLKLLIK